jgi:hypothetical protein
MHASQGAGFWPENAADRPVDRSSRRRYHVLKIDAKKKAAAENEEWWKPDLCAALTGTVRGGRI